MRALFAAAAFAASSPTCGADEVRRSEFTVQTADGVQLHIREVAPERVTGRAVVLVHGARVPGAASFDLAAPGGSLAADLVLAGHRVYIPDLRGYGRSERPTAYSAAPEANAPMTRVAEVLLDLDAAVDAVRRRTGQRSVALFGWATGGMWSGAYAAQKPANISHLIVFNALYGGSSEHQTLREAPQGAWRADEAASLTAAWDRSIALDDKVAWRDPAVRDAYVAAAMASDIEGAKAQPPVMRAPTGALADSVLQAQGQRLYDAGLIAAHTLVVRSTRDFWSREADAATLYAELRSATSRKLVELRDATHFAHLDRPERGRATLIAETLALLRR